MSLVSSFNETENHYFQLMVSLHIHTKKYLLIAEEITEEGEIFIQPLKEQRDAFDHLMRCYGAASNPNNQLSNAELEQYVLTNLDKACGHIYRAFFDTADWLTYMLRKWIREKIQEAGDTMCHEKLPDYPKIKKALNDVPLKIADLRRSKDVAKLEGRKSQAIQEVNEYVEILNTLIDIRKNVLDAFGP